ncbi:hypothetical protein GEMRC1_002013 [Eukaryota sp. GEM-RC1]
MLSITKLKTDQPPFNASQLADHLRVRITVHSFKDKLPKDCHPSVLSKPAVLSQSCEGFEWPDDDKLPLSFNSDSHSLLTHNHRFLFELVVQDAFLPTPVAVDFPSTKGWTILAWSFFQLRPNHPSTSNILSSTLCLQLYAAPLVSPILCLPAPPPSVLRWSESPKKFLSSLLLPHSSLSFCFSSLSPSSARKPLPLPKNLSRTSSLTASSLAQQSAFSPTLLSLLSTYASRPYLPSWCSPSSFTSSPLTVPLSSYGCSASLFSSCGRFLILGLTGVCCPIVILEAYNFSKLLELPGHFSIITDICYTTAKNTFIIVSCASDGSLNVYRFKESNNSFSIKSDSYQHEVGITSVTVLQNPDEPAFLIAITDENGRIPLLRFNGKSISLFSADTDESPYFNNSCCVSGSALVSSTSKGAVIIWKILPEGKFVDEVIQTNDCDHFDLSHVSSQRLSNHVLVTSVDSGVCFLIDIPNRIILQRFDLHSGSLPCLSPDRNWLYLQSRDGFNQF